MLLISYVPKFNLAFMRNSFTYKCAQLWNKFPEEAKATDNVNILKSKLRSAVIFIFLYIFFIIITFYSHVYIDYRIYRYIFLILDIIIIIVDLMHVRILKEHLCS